MAVHVKKDAVMFVTLCAFSSDKNLLLIVDYEFIRF